MPSRPRDALLNMTATVGDPEQQVERSKAATARATSNADALSDPTAQPLTALPPFGFARQASCALALAAGEDSALHMCTRLTGADGVQSIGGNREGVQCHFQSQNVSFPKEWVQALIKGQGKARSRVRHAIFVSTQDGWRMCIKRVRNDAMKNEEDITADSDRGRETTEEG